MSYNRLLNPYNICIWSASSTLKPKELLKKEIIAAAVNWGLKRQAFYLRNLKREISSPTVSSQDSLTAQHFIVHKNF